VTGLLIVVGLFVWLMVVIFAAMAERAPTCADLPEDTPGPRFLRAGRGPTQDARDTRGMILLGVPSPTGNKAGSDGDRPRTTEALENR
jgi:hypothetical protein